MQGWLAPISIFWRFVTFCDLFEIILVQPPSALPTQFHCMSKKPCCKPWAGWAPSWCQKPASTSIYTSTRHNGWWVSKWFWLILHLKEVFSGLTALQTLDLWDNELSQLPSEVFSGLTALETLKLWGNALSQLPSEVFSGLTALETLNLWDNELSQLPSEVFLRSRPWRLWICGTTSSANCHQRSFLGSRLCRL